MTRYRRRPLERGESAASALGAALVGIGTAAVAYYVTRLFLAREPLAERRLPSHASGTTGSETGRMALAAPRVPVIEGPSPDEAGGHDPGA